jgi:two-component system chemotaxis response regulator CheY
MLYINRRVLIADDQSTPRQQLREYLRHTGCAIVGECRSTDDLLIKFETLQPDVVFIDVTLIGTMDALVVIQRLRRMEPSLTIFATASASQSSILMEAMTMGAADFILKPFQQHSVRSCLERNLG